MEEDIKILEEMIKKANVENADMNDIFYGEHIQAIENLISRNKELEKYEKYYETERVIWSRKDYIPKSKVREKIEEYKNMRDKKFDYLSIMYNKLDLVVQVLEELLEERN